MARSDINRSGEMEVFVRVVDLGGFTAAAKNLGLTPSGVSKLISRLEARLGTRLVNRTTRKLLLTVEGRSFYERALAILADIEEAERLAGSGAAPRGHLTVNSNIPFGMLHVMPLLPRFMSEHPDVTLDVVLTDTLVDLMQERADVAIRAGPLGASRLIARKLGTSRMAVVAAPSYLARYGAPKTPADLAAHRGIGWTFPRASAAGRSAAPKRSRRRCRRRSPAPATARLRAGSRWAASAWRGSRCFTSAPISMPGGSCRCCKTSILEIARTSTRSMSATPARCRRGCAPLSISWQSTSGSAIRPCGVARTASGRSLADR